MSVPPAMHQPWTAATVGFEISWSLAKVLPKVPIIWTSATVSQTRSPASLRPGRAVDQSRPKPAQNAGPSALSNTTRTSWSRSAASRAAPSSSRRAGVIVL